MAASIRETQASTSRPTVVKFQPPPLEIRGEEYQPGDGGELGRENGLLTPTSPVAGPSGLGTLRDDKHERRKIGHRRVTESGQVTYKKVPTSQLMGAIQLGIENSIGSVVGKPQRDLLMQDFTVIETVYFPVEGSSTTPSHSFSDFRFKTYAPIAFRYFRELFHIKPEDFLASLCTEPLIELSNPGASGSIFYISNDDQFIIKTVQHKEADFLQNLLPGYYMNLNQNPRTLLPKFFGLYTYQSLGKNVRLLAMNNLLPSTIRMHQKYDLKGSTYKRRASKYERAKESPTLKDLDFMEDHPDGIYLESTTYEAVIRTILRDCLVLESFKIMDYSLLMGVHNLDAPPKEGSVDEGQLHYGGGHAFPMNGGGTSEAETSQKKPDPADRKMRRQKTKFSAWESIQAEAPPVELGDEYPAGGIPARNSKGDRLLVFLGIIDILQNYRFLKKFEHAWKSVLHDGDTISVHRPSFYASRFQDFMRTKVFKKIPSPFKQSPSKRKSRERRGTASSNEDKHRGSGGEIVPGPSGISAAGSGVRQDSIPTVISGTGEMVSISEQRGSVKKITFDVGQKIDTQDVKETKRVERLFASSTEPTGAGRGSITETQLNFEDTDAKHTERKPPFETDV